MHTISKGSPYGERISGEGLLGLTEYKQAQAMPCNLSNFLLSLRASARRTTFFIRDLTSARGKASEIMLNTNLINNSVTFHSEIARARTTSTGSCS